MFTPLGCTVLGTNRAAQASIGQLRAAPICSNSAPEILAVPYPSSVSYRGGATIDYAATMNVIWRLRACPDSPGANNRHGLDAAQGWAYPDCR